MSHPCAIQNTVLCTYSSILIPSRGFHLENKISPLSHCLLVHFSKQSWSTRTRILPGGPEGTKNQTRAHLSKMPWNALGLVRFWALATTTLLHKSFSADHAACYCRHALWHLRFIAPCISSVALYALYTSFTGFRSTSFLLGYSVVSL